MKSGYIVYFVMALLASMFVYSQFFDESGGHQVEPITDPEVIEIYPRLYEAIYGREAVLLEPYLEHDSTPIRQQAWRALASTPIDTIKPYLDLALNSDLEEPWMALSMHPFSTDQVRQLEQYWEERPELRSGISLVLGRQGDRESLDFLLEKLVQVAGSSYEYDFALALGRLMVSFPLEQVNQQRVIEQAFQTDDPEIIRAYLYGFYRGNRQALTAESRKLLYSSWKGYGLGNRDEIDQYMVRILKDDVFYEIILYQNSEDLLDVNVQLAVELAQLAGDVELNDRNRLAIRMLLTHENPHVVHETLTSLKGGLEGEGRLLNFISSEIVNDSRTPSYTWLPALEIAAAQEAGLMEKHNKRLEEIAEGHTYLLGQVLTIREQYDSREEFLNRIRQEIENGESLRTQYALNALSRYWSTQLQDDKEEDSRERVRQLVFNALESGDRGVAYAAAGLLEDERLFDSDDFRRIHTVLKAFTLPEDLEVYQRFGTLYRQRFENQAQSAIDSLAALGNVPLNRSLQQAGWDVQLPEEVHRKLRKPNWERLWEMGKNPLWVLQTEKGYINIEMNTLSAPATVSAIDSLTRAGAYNDVPFHRVIPNFVIQGGDIERKDGFGGPDFTLPTEASSLEFHRGAAGIASAGTDTEGSQYFFMHQWKPHLNAGYTRFGEVFGGIDVVDRILPGDRVVAVYWN